MACPFLVALRIHVQRVDRVRQGFRPASQSYYRLDSCLFKFQLPPSIGSCSTSLFSTILTETAYQGGVCVTNKVIQAESWPLLISLSTAIVTGKKIERSMSQ